MPTTSQLTTSSQLLSVPASSDVRDNILNTIRNGLIQNGVSNPNVTVNTDFGLIATAIGNEVAIAGNNAVLLANMAMPDSATGSFLDRILGIYGLTRRTASNSFGSVVATASNSTFVPQGAQLTDPQGNKFQVSIGGVYGNGSSIQVQSINTGSTVNEDAGTILTWTQPPAFFSPTVSVSTTNPITGGEDAEDDDTARARLLAYLANPPGGANPSQIIQWAQASNPVVQTAFVSAAARGPGTVDISVVGYANTNDSDRSVNALTLANQINPYIQGQLPQFVDGYVCTVQNYGLDIAVNLSLPLPVNATPSGPGGGWIDPAPLPTTSSKPAIRVIDGYALSGNTSGVPQNTATGFWVDFPVAPVSSIQYNISYLSPTTLTLYQGTTSGTYTPATNYGSLSSYTTLYYITINSPFYRNNNTNEIVQPGDWIFPSAVNTSSYVSIFLSYMQGLGPGERTAVSGLLPRALRQPAEQIAWNYKINTRLLKPILESGPEVYDGTIAFRGSYLNTGTSPTSSFVDYGTLTTNSDPAYAVYAPPTTYNQFATMVAPSFIFIPNNFGIYPM